MSSIVLLRLVPDAPPGSPPIPNRRSGLACTPLVQAPAYAQAEELRNGAACPPPSSTLTLSSVSDRSQRRGTHYCISLKMTCLE